MVSKKTEPEFCSSVCETRDVFSARLSHFVPLRKKRISENDISLIISVAGEAGNNSFGHNLGQWQDVLETISKNNIGTITLMAWGLQ